MQSEFFFGVVCFGVFGAGVRGAGELVTIGRVVVVAGVGFGVSVATLDVGEAEGDAVGDLLAEAVTEGEAEAVGVGVTSVVPP